MDTERSELAEHVRQTEHEINWKATEMAKLTNDADYDIDEKYENVPSPLSDAGLMTTTMADDLRLGVFY
ncbi:unnamed protein product [Protopolystoma xenopodis]|uniref:Uncharacterized protein n=1 Tax=Protopolystoma xenopodis TaxID=117903 RepID=A0A448WPR5_9PLAT|nr:unnamed protein product [Protopolystoma xenopodis]